jgi:hypothetical protein
MRRPNLQAHRRRDNVHLGPWKRAILHEVTEHFLIDSGHLNRLLVDGNRWPHGPVTDFRSERIGAGFGMSGVVHRVNVTVDGGTASLVAKIESVENVERALAFRLANESALAGSIPALYGSSFDGSRKTGLLLLEDVSPATQGDELSPCSPERAHSLIGVLARLHAATWDASAVSDGWGRPRWEPGRWNDRLVRAAERYPGQFTPSTLSRLAHLDLEADEAASELAAGPTAWIHGDPHLDNVLWRPNGNAVVVDWATSSIGPPAFDLAVLMMSLSMGSSASLTPESTIESYTEAIARNGLVELSALDTTRMVRLALRQLIQGMVGFAGFPTEPTEPRALLLRDHAASNAVTALAWVGR